MVESVQSDNDRRSYVSIMMLTISSNTPSQHDGYMTERILTVWKGLEGGLGLCHLKSLHCLGLLLDSLLFGFLGL